MANRPVQRAATTDVARWSLGVLLGLLSVRPRW